MVCSMTNFFEGGPAVPAPVVLNTRSGPKADSPIATMAHMKAPRTD